MIIQFTNKVIVAVTCFLIFIQLPPVWAQTQLPAAAKPANDSAQTAGTVALSFQQAVQLALENNFNSLLAHERVNEAKGRATEARAKLFPDLSGTVVQRSETVNLAALGFQPGVFPGSIPALIGPFNNFDARARLVQNIFNLRAVRQFQAGQSDVRLTTLEEQLARQQVVTQAALAYLNTITANRAVETAKANLELARSLLKLAQDQRAVGVATGVDVTRAETRLSAEEVRLAKAENDAQQAQFALLRATGLPLQSKLILTDPLQFKPETLPVAEITITEAERERLEIRIAEEQVRQSGYSLSAARSESLPTLEFVADYGESGVTPTQSAVPTRTVGVRLNVPLFGLGSKGRVQGAQSRQRQAELRLNDTRLQVEEDVRLALQTVTAAATQVRAAQQTVTLAERELQMARDRFAAGVADNLEIINAQTTIANARESEVSALAQFNAARINLASAWGRIESFRW